MSDKQGNCLQKVLVASEGYERFSEANICNGRKKSPRDVIWDYRCTLDSGAIWVSLGDPGTPLLNPPAPLGVPASAQYFPIENQNIMYIMNL